MAVLDEALSGGPASVVGFVAPGGQGKTAIVMRKEMGFPLWRHGKHVATVRAHLETKRLMRELLGPSGRRAGEIPFAVDAAGHVHAPDGDESSLPDLSAVVAAAGPREARQTLPEWVVVTRRDPGSGLTFENSTKA